MYMYWFHLVQAYINISIFKDELRCLTWNVTLSLTYPLSHDIVTLVSCSPINALPHPVPEYETSKDAGCIE